MDVKLGSELEGFSCQHSHLWEGPETEHAGAVLVFVMLTFLYGEYIYSCLFAVPLEISKSFQSHSLGRDDEPWVALLSHTPWCHRARRFLQWVLSTKSVPQSLLQWRRHSAPREMCYTYLRPGLQKPQGLCRYHFR